MSAKVIIISVVAVAVAAAGALIYVNYNTDKGVDVAVITTGVDSAIPVTEANCVSEDCLEVENLEYPTGELPAEVVAALSSAIDDEYKAHSTYEAVIANIGSARPFSMIIRAEEKHISSLKALFDKYGVAVPADQYNNLEVASTKAANCSIGVQAEIDNAALYRDNLLPAVTSYSDITSVFTKLMNASQEKHLPAFQKCAA